MPNYSQPRSFYNYVNALAEAYLKWFELKNPKLPMPKKEVVFDNLMMQDVRGSHRAVSEMLTIKIELTAQQASKCEFQPDLKFVVEPTIVHDEDYANAYWFKIIAIDVDGVQHDYQITITFDDIVGYCYLEHPEVNPLFLDVSPMAHFGLQLSQLGR